MKPLFSKLISISFDDIKLVPYEYFVDEERHVGFDDPGKTEVKYNGKIYPAKQLPGMDFNFGLDISTKKDKTIIKKLLYHSLFVKKQITHVFPFLVKEKYGSMMQNNRTIVDTPSDEDIEGYINSLLNVRDYLSCAYIRKVKFKVEPLPIEEENKVDFTKELNWNDFPIHQFQDFKLTINYEELK
jgi:hypothetical protein